MQPVLVAFDGSPAAQAAVEAAARLFPDRPLVVVSVWEPGLAMALAAPRGDLTGLGFLGPSPQEMATMDRAQRDHAIAMADAGARLARERGAQAEALAVADELEIGETIAGLAEERDAGAVVVGSRGLGGFKAGLFGSTSRALLQRCARPLLVVKEPEPS
jgi:nucleotide-binding universal stress UspA family protein